MPVITIRGQLGSGAPEIGKLVADKLHIDYVDREIIARVAELLIRGDKDVILKEMPPSSLLGRVSEALEHNAYYRASAYLSTWEMPLKDTQYLTGLNSVINDLVRGGAIVIRPGSQFILKDLPGALHVFVVAPLELRVKRVMETSKTKESETRTEIKLFDSSHREFARRYFHAELEDPLHYDLVLNTGHINFNDAVSVIVDVLPLKQTTTFR